MRGKSWKRDGVTRVDYPATGIMCTASQKRFPTSRCIRISGRRWLPPPRCPVMYSSMPFAYWKPRRSSRNPRNFSTGWLGNCGLIFSANWPTYRIAGSSLKSHAVSDCRLRRSRRTSIAERQAYAQVSRDFDLVKEHAVTVSPTMIFNEGRQRLNGNVGYRVIEANVRELLQNRPDQQSWC
jgi:hypothetical protein